MKRSSRGVVLVTVLWSISLLSALAMAASVTFRGFVGVMMMDRNRVQGDALLTAGLEASAGMIEASDDTPLREIEITEALSTGSVRAHLNDEGGRIDIGKAPVAILAGLLRSVGAPAAAADGIARRVVESRQGCRHRDNTRRGAAALHRRTADWTDCGNAAEMAGRDCAAHDRVWQRNREPADCAAGRDRCTAGCRRGKARALQEELYN